MTGSQRTTRLYALDGLRGVLALYVLFSHMLPFAALGPVAMRIARLFSHGGAAVDVFFALSGLVIARSLARFRYQAGPFLGARIRRLYPVYLPVLVFAIAIQPLGAGFAAMPWIAPSGTAHFIWSGGWGHGAGVDILLHLLMAHGLVPDALGPDRWVRFLGAAWSLSVETQFYLLAVLLTRRQSAPPSAWALTGLAVAALLWRHALPPPLQFSRAFLPNRAQFFALGLAGATVLESRTWGRYGAVMAGALAIGWARQGLDGFAAPLVWTLALAVEAVPGHILLAPLRAALTGRTVLRLGALSYPLYLVNEPVQKLLGLGLARLAAGDGTVFTVLWLPLGVGLPLALAWALHRFVEQPSQGWPLPGLGQRRMKLQ